MSCRVVIAGAGGFGRGVFGWLSSSARHREEYEISEIVYIDDAAPSIDPHASVISTIDAYVPQPGDRVLCAMGDPETRMRVVEKLWAASARFHTFVDDRAALGEGVSVAEGSVICPGVVISADAQIAEHVHVNFNCSIGHDTVIGGFSTLSPTVNIMGEVQVGEGSFFGGSATVLPRLEIGAGAIVGAGAVVTKNVSEQQAVVGVPARPWRSNVRSDD